MGPEKKMDNSKSFLKREELLSRPILLAQLIDPTNLKFSILSYFYFYFKKQFNKNL
jgi:hypothetical protein